MRLQKVETAEVIIAFTKEDCALQAYVLELAYLQKGGQLAGLLLGQWLAAAAVAFKAGALLCTAGGVILDTVLLPATAEDQACYSVAAIDALAEALVASTQPATE